MNSFSTITCLRNAQAHFTGSCVIRYQVNIKLCEEVMQVANMELFHDKVYISLEVQ